MVARRRRMRSRTGVWWWSPIPGVAQIVGLGKDNDQGVPELDELAHVKRIMSNPGCEHVTGGHVEAKRCGMFGIPIRRGEIIQPGQGFLAFG